MKTIKNNGKTNVQEVMKDYHYQELLTPELDKLDGDFDQNILNEIVLWKVNRYAEVPKTTLKLLNEIKKTDKVVKPELTKKILSALLHKDQKGIRLAMASTILRFKNPSVYQIIDQRVYRYIMNEEMKNNFKSVDEQIEYYETYLKELRKRCIADSIPFETSDRVYYVLDKESKKPLRESKKKEEKK